MSWVDVSREEYRSLIGAPGVQLGGTFTDPDGIHGEPQIVTEWVDGKDLLVAVHRCWPQGHGTGFSRPCQFQRFVDDEDGAS